MSVESGARHGAEILDPRQKRIDFVLFPHGKKHRKHLSVAADHIRSAASRPGVTAVFLENAIGTPESSAQIRGAFAQGRRLEDLYLKTDSFVHARGRMIDALAVQHPDKIVVVPEWQDPEVIAQKDEIGRLSRSIYDAPNERKVRSYLAIVPEHDDRRDAQIENLIAEVAAEPQVTSVVPILGEAHTFPSLALHERGFQVSRTFPEKEQGQVLFDPLEVLVRKQRLHPGTPITDEEVALAVRRIRSLSIRELMPFGRSHQTLLRTVYTKFR